MIGLHDAGSVKETYTCSVKETPRDVRMLQKSVCVNETCISKYWRGWWYTDILCIYTYVYVYICI